MSSLLRSLRKRVKANATPAKPTGKIYAGTVESVSIRGRVFPGLTQVSARTAKGNR